MMIRNLFAIDDHSHDVFPNIVALDAFVLVSGISYWKRKTSKVLKIGCR